MKNILTALFIAFANITIAQQILVKVSAGNYTRVRTVVVASLSKSIAGANSYKIVNIENGSSAPVQTIPGNKIIFILPDSLQPQQVAIYKLVKLKSSRGNDFPVEVIKNETGLKIMVKGKDLLFYNSALIRPPGEFPEIYSRSGFIHPLYTPAGKVLTDDFPKGHAHQHGIMMAWVSTLFKTQPHDFWNQHAKTGNVEHVKIENISRGPVITTAQLRLSHYTNSNEKVLDEKWTITIYPFHNYFLFDILSDQVNSSKDTLYLNKYHYGGMSFRGSKQWNKDDSVHYRENWRINTDVQPNIKTADGTRANYLSASGSVDGVSGGLTVFGFPSNFNYPQPVRVHPVMPYWCFAPTASGAFTINPSESFVSAYRYFVHNNNPALNFIRQLNNDLVYPIEVTTIEKKH